MTKGAKTDQPDHTGFRDDKTPRTEAKESWANAEETMTEPPAGSPKASDQARKS